MIRRIEILCVVLLATGAFGQAPKAEHPKYKLDFVLKQLDHGKVISTHNFVTSGEANEGRSQIRTGNRIPMRTAEKQVNFVDVGFNCDVSIATGTTMPTLDVTWDLSTMVPDSHQHDADGADTFIIRQVRARSAISVPIGKQTLVSSADDINSGQQFELDVTVTPES